MGLRTVREAETISLFAWNESVKDAWLLRGCVIEHEDKPGRMKQEAVPV